MEIIGKLTLVQNKFAVTNKCINFKNKEQEDLLISQFVHRDFDSNIFMQDGDTILVPLNYEECIRYNYCYFNNKINDYEKKRYFCYITNYTYVEPNVTRISIEVDTLQTFLFDIDKFRGNMERCHSARRINIGTEQTPKYIINPDLYFMEDDVDIYKPVITEKAPNPHQTYIVLTYALPVTYKITAGKYDEEEGFVSQNGIFRDKTTNISVVDKETNVPESMDVMGEISFPVSSQYTFDISGTTGVDFNIIRKYNYSTKDIGDTRLYTIILPTAPNNGVDLDYLPYETFREMFPLLQDKLVNTFYIDNVDEIFTQPVGIKIYTNALHNIISEYKYYAVPYTRLQALKQMISIDENNDLNPNKWVNKNVDDLLRRDIMQEKKLELYPYSFVKIASLGCEMVWKYQENYRILENHSNTCYSYVKAVNVLSPNSKVVSTLLYSKDNLINYDEETFNNIDNANSINICNYYIQMEQGYLLPSLSIYMERYTEYLNYQKAIVDANNILGTIGDIGKAGFSVAGSSLGTTLASAQGRLNSALTPKTQRKGAMWRREYTKIKGEMTDGISEVGYPLFKSGLNIVSRYVNTALQEQALKKQPMSVLHQGTTTDDLFSTMFENNGNIYDYILTKYECMDNNKSIYEQKFYNYGYSIPVDVELTREEFFEIINNRKYFCYMEWNSLEIESFIPTIYINDIISRLSNGVRFENTGNSLLYQTYDTTYNNKETHIPAKPFFVKEY